MREVVPLKLLALGSLLAVFWAEGNPRRAAEGGPRRRSHRVQQGRCSYTFVLPEADPPPCQHPGDTFNINTLQRDSPAGPSLRMDEEDLSIQRVQQLERVLENNTQWLLKVGEEAENLPLSVAARSVCQTCWLMGLESGRLWKRTFCRLWKRVFLSTEDDDPRVRDTLVACFLNRMPPFLE